jgi:hypothetical protein
MIADRIMSVNWLQTICADEIFNYKYIVLRDVHTKLIK